ncbi:hypothetical protein ITJ57_08955 [Plantibacter sp. VKM Ac-2880]|uniref:hypothetical protein n=1 Tax=Plantibacter sp. VKM Ac-2880 TaxID=2783827 RepID=UPI00188F056E|nr:hypothetical protein [Plantibacter sp. VKM Ac-2880]MBF4568897.1 hypothetical protein [Plantibacter sp. VKM Ac-2880]
MEDEPDVGVWGFCSSLTPGSGPSVAIDSFADEFSVWPHQMNGEVFSMAEDGVDEAKAWLEG